MYYVPRSFTPQQYSSSGKRDQDRPSWDLRSRGGETHNKQNPGCPALVSIMKENKSGAGVETRKGQGGRLLGEAGSERRAKSGRYLQVSQAEPRARHFHRTAEREPWECVYRVKC